VKRIGICLGVLLALAGALTGCVREKDLPKQTATEEAALTAPLSSEEKGAVPSEKPTEEKSELQTAEASGVTDAPPMPVTTSKAPSTTTKAPSATTKAPVTTTAPPVSEGGVELPDHNWR